MLKSKIPKQQNLSKYYNAFRNSFRRKTQFLLLTYNYELLEIVNKLKMGKAPSLDSIVGGTIKELFYLLLMCWFICIVLVLKVILFQNI